MTNEHLLSNIRLGLSISESPDIKARGFSDIHFKDIFIEFSRYMLACGATLAYGGDFRQGGFTEELLALKATYKDNKHKIVNYLGWPLHAEIDNWSPKEKLKYQKTAEFVRCPIPDGVDDKIPRDKFLPPIKTNLDYMLIWARSMSKMRREFLAKLNDAQVLLGGRLNGYSSKYPGVVEEAFEVMKAGKPLYLIGAFGGATQAVIDAISGERPKSLTAEGQYELWQDFERETKKANAAKAKADLAEAPNRIKAAEDAMAKAEAEFNAAQSEEDKDSAAHERKAAQEAKQAAEKALANAKNDKPAAKLEDYRGLVEHFNKHAPAGEERIDYTKLTDFFNEKGIAGLNNHLTAEENQRLFVTPHMAEMIALTLKGLVRIKK